MCLPFFHKWTKWGEVQTRRENVRRPKDVSFLYEEPEYEHYVRVERFQTRTCLRCGAYQERVIDRKCFNAG